MQTQLNNIHPDSSSSRNKGLIGTAIIHGVLFSMLLLAGFSTAQAPQTEEGILVNFGTGETGTGMIEPSPPAFKESYTPPVIKEVTSPPPSSPRTVAKTKEEPLLTQSTEEAPAVKKADPEAAKKRLEKIEADKKIKEQLEAERIVRRQEEAERKRIEAGTTTELRYNEPDKKCSG